MSKDNPGVGGFVVTSRDPAAIARLMGAKPRDPTAVKVQQVRNLKRLHATSIVIAKLLPKTAAIEAAKREGYRAEARENITQVRKIRAGMGA